LGSTSVVFARLPFYVPAAAGYDRLTLKVSYDDGFVCLPQWDGNHAPAIAPQTLAWNSTATGTARRLTRSSRKTIDLGAFASSLAPGRNRACL